jgi:hypothetical protein
MDLMIIHDGTHAAEGGGLFRRETRKGTTHRYTGRNISRQAPAALQQYETDSLPADPLNAAAVNPG